jgi:bacillopeptidase F
VDGGPFTEIDLFEPPDSTDPRNGEKVQAIIFKTPELPSGRHTLTVEVTGLKNALATDNAVVVDAFDFSPALAPPAVGTRAEETSERASPTPDWEPADPAKPWSGGAALHSTVPLAQVEFTFPGTEVRWIGLRGPQTGIARVLLDGSFATEVDTFSATEVQGIVFAESDLAPGTHTLTIEVTDRRNPAATGNLIVVDAFDFRSRFEDTDPSILYTAGWTQGHVGRAWSGTSPHTGAGSAALSRMPGEQATFTFRGTEVSWIGFRGPQTGIARVFLDGAPGVEVDTYAPVEELQAVIFRATGLADANHTLTIEVTGLKNAASVDPLIIVDAFDVTLPIPAPTVTRLQQTDPSVSYTGIWTQDATPRQWSGETAAFSGAAGARATFTFTATSAGTSVRWIGSRGPQRGIARVLLDGTEVALVDTFSFSELLQVVNYRATVLAPGPHTLAIEVTGQKNPGATGTESCPTATCVVVDAFDVF